MRWDIELRICKSHIHKSNPVYSEIIKATKISRDENYPVKTKQVMDTATDGDNLCAENDLENKIKELMESIKSLESEKNHIREEFGIQRAKMKEISKFESEVKQLRHLNERLESENQDLRNQLLQGTSDKGERDSPILAPGVMLSAVTKTFARKVASQLGADASNISQDNLEDSMRKAQEDAEVLRSLVIPLEEEIQALKEKIRQQDELLRKFPDEKGVSPTKSGILPLTPVVDVDIVGPPTSSVHASQKGSTMKSVGSVSSLNEVQTAASTKTVPDPTTTLLEDQSRFAEINQDKMSESSSQGAISSGPQQLCDMCSNYEAQLVKSQQQTQELEKQLASQERTLQRYREDLAKESDFRKEMEEKWNEKKEEHKMQADLKEKMQTAEEALNELRQTYSQTITEVTDQLVRLSQDREKVQKELTRLQLENENLVGKHSAHSQQLQNEMINLPDKVEDLHELLLKFHEELIAAKVAKEAAEEQVKTFRCENQLLRDQMSAEQQGRENMEDNLTSELVNLKTQLGAYERDRRLNQEKQEQLEPIIENNKRLMEELKSQLTESQKAKSHLEEIVAELRSRVGSLQQELDNAETVQQDFVRLSQSLQVQLEKIRDADSQVRWQHEEDVEECPICRNSFSVTRRKQHCRHCGRILCTNCLPHTVLSGPRKRPSRVCGVCHTLLVKDTAPYFSTEPPHTPD
ncbi:Putative 1-phosphatidylinositol 3-phosphate 5-kinase [Gryllus bimaculatus]|nr:Putative 1-phosphatidylinositol 3-phosphate 5-kinase [Gryllus bimaculatus]